MPSSVRIYGRLHNRGMVKWPKVIISVSANLKPRHSRFQLMTKDVNRGTDLFLELTSRWPGGSAKQNYFGRVGYISLLQFSMANMNCFLTMVLVHYKHWIKLGPKNPISYSVKRFGQGLVKNCQKIFVELFVKYGKNLFKYFLLVFVWSLIAQFCNKVWY